MSKALRNTETNAGEFSKWYIVPDSGRVRIRRYKLVEGKTIWESYPFKNFRNMDKAEIASLLIRLNSTYEVDKRNAEERYVFDHSYINIKSMQAFEKQLNKSISDHGKKGHVLHVLNEYVLDFFVLQNKLPDPSRWHLKENEWGEWLLQQDLNPSTIRMVISTANRFNKFLIEKMYPEMSTPRKLEPIGKLKLDKISSELKKKAPKKYITSDVYEKILADAAVKAPELLPAIKLCYHFGLRINEVFGLTKDKFLKDSLLVDEQGDKVVDDIVSRRDVKTTQRRVPYWNMTARDAWKLVQQLKPMHPDTLIKKVNLFLEKFNHTSHDFRRTFITDSLRKKHWQDVQKAVGHTDVRTTMGYNQDDRSLSEEKADLD